MIHVVKLVAAAAVTVVTTLSAQTCPDGRGMIATLGVGRLQCVTADVCSLAERTASFSVEPSVWNVDPRGPAAGMLRDGDVVVAVDGQLITTRAGGALMADLPLDRAVMVRIRRNGVEGDVRIVPALRCDRPRLLVMTPREVQRTGASSRIDFGMTLECGGCGWRERNGYLVFETSRPVIIVAVDSGGPAARAHLVNDDVILEVNGIPITDARAGRTLGALRSGQAVTLGVWRQGHITAVSVTSRAASTKD